MRSRVVQLGVVLICGAIFAAQVANDALTRRVPSVESELVADRPTFSTATTPTNELQPVGVQSQQLKSVFDGVVSESLFADPQASLISQAGHNEESSDEFPPLTLPETADTPAILPPTPELRAEPRVLLQELPAPSPSTTTLEPEHPNEPPGLLDEPTETDSPSEPSRFPPLTLPGKEDPISRDDESFDFQPVREDSSSNTETKYAGQTSTTPLPVPEVVPTPSPGEQRRVRDVLTIPDNAAGFHPEQLESGPVKFDPIERDEDQSLLLQAARNALRLEEKDAAIARFTEYLRRYPEDAEIRLEFAGVLSASDRPEVGAKQIEHLLRQFPNNLDVLRRYADMQMQLNNYAKAEPVLDQLFLHTDYRLDAAVDLARVYANTNRRKAASQLYEEVLRDTAAQDPKRMQQFAQLLLDIRRPAEAMELLWELHTREPLNLDTVRLLILASGRTGNHGSTFEYIGRMQSIEPENTKARHEFAMQLFSEGFYRESILIDQQILEFEPGNPDSLIRSAAANLKIYEPQSARALLSGVTDGATNVPYLRVLANYHSLVGEHADAIAICRRVLSENPCDYQTRLVLGDVYLRAAQLDRSHDTFASVAAATLEPGVVNGPQLHTDAVLSQSRALAEMLRFDEAFSLLESTNWPPAAEDAVLDTYVAIQSQGRRYGEAIQNVRVALADSLGNSGREIRLRSWLGLLLARNGEYASSIQELSVAEQMADEPLAEAIYGKYQAYKMLSDQAGMHRAVAEYLGPLSSNSHLRVRVAELATEDCDCCFAREMLQPLDSLCDNNPLVANRLGEACQMCASCEATPNCVGYFQRALVNSPSNVQALLGIARTFSRVKNYEQAYCFYRKAEQYMSDDLDLKREIGRMIREWKGPEAATQAYERAMQLTTTEHLVVEAKRNPELMAEIEQEYQNRSDFGATVATEMTGKQVAGWKPLTAISIFEGVATMEPHNQDAVFEIGQAYSQLNRTCCAISQYERLLCMNPCHREAQVALDRNRREISPQLHLFTRARSQKGRQDLSTIDHFAAGNLLQFPLGDEDEYLQVGYMRATYDPPGAPQLDGHVAIGRIQWKPIWPVVLFSQFDYEVYDYGFKPRWNFDIGSRFRHVENAELRFHMRQENVAQNRVAIRRDIHRYGPELGHYWRPSQRFEVDTLYRYWEYSDDNSALEGGIHTGYQLTFGRDRLRWLTDFDWMAYREQTQFLVADDLDSITRPYFAPNKFWFLSGGLELRHYFGCDTFKAGNRRWIEGYLGGRVDSDGVGYGSVRGEFLWDYHSRVSASGYFEYLTSSAYVNGEAGLKLTLRY